MYITDILDDYNNQSKDGAAYLMAYREYLDNKLEDIREALTPQDRSESKLLCIPCTINNEIKMRYVSSYDLVNITSDDINDLVPVYRLPFNPTQDTPASNDSDSVAFDSIATDIQQIVENIAVQASSIEAGLKYFSDKVDIVTFRSMVSNRISQFSGFITSTIISTSTAGLTGKELISCSLSVSDFENKVSVSNKGEINLIDQDKYTGSVTLNVLTNVCSDFVNGVVSLWNTIKTIPKKVDYILNKIGKVISYLTGNVEESFSRYQLLDKKGCGRIDVPIFQFTIGRAGASSFNDLFDSRLNAYIFDLSDRPEGVIPLFSGSQFNYALDLHKVIHTDSSKTDWNLLFQQAFPFALYLLALKGDDIRGVTQLSDVDIVLPGGSTFDFICRFSNISGGIETMVFSIYPMFIDESVQNLNDDSLITNAIRNDFRIAIKNLLNTYPTFSTTNNINNQIQSIVDNLFNGEIELVGSCNYFYRNFAEIEDPVIGGNPLEYGLMHIILALVLRTVDIANGLNLANGTISPFWFSFNSNYGRQSGFATRCLIPNYLQNSSLISVNGISGEFIDDNQDVTPYDLTFKPYSKENAFQPSIKYLTASQYAEKITKILYYTGLTVAFIVVAAKAIKTVRKFKLKVESKRLSYIDAVRAYNNNPTAENAQLALRAAGSYRRSAKLLSIFSAAGDVDQSVDNYSFTSQINSILKLIK